MLIGVHLCHETEDSKTLHLKHLLYHIQVIWAIKEEKKKIVINVIDVGMQGSFFFKFIIMFNV